MVDIWGDAECELALRDKVDKLSWINLIKWIKLFNFDLEILMIFHSISKYRDSNNNISCGDLLINITKVIIYYLDCHSLKDHYLYHLYHLLAEMEVPGPSPSEWMGWLDEGLADWQMWRLHLCPERQNLSLQGWYPLAVSASAEYDSRED